MHILLKLHEALQIYLPDVLDALVVEVTVVATILQWPAALVDRLDELLRILVLQGTAELRVMQRDKVSCKRESYAGCKACENGIRSSSLCLNSWYRCSRSS